ncbi:MAG TPA: cephalosporin hydroxylase family protein [Candidatus Acidoferrales bacterium]|nr:cephalosporin hydroxylase family protein [Candidatus Acidoferrales bacterium]
MTGDRNDASDEAAIETMAADPELTKLSHAFFLKTCDHRYSYNFSWLGRPVIQYPQDLIAVQEVIWSVKPDLIVETGIAHGGSLIFYASLLELIGGPGKVIGIDNDIRSHNRAAIEAHPLSTRITMVQGSSVDDAVARSVSEVARDKQRVVVILDSNHTHAHVLRELNLYSPLVHAGSYVIVFDTAIERMPADAFPNRPWGPGNNPHTAVQEFLSRNDRFAVDNVIDNKLLISAAPGGYLRCVKN